MSLFEICLGVTMMAWAAIYRRGISAALVHYGSGRRGLPMATLLMASMLGGCAVLEADSERADVFAPVPQETLQQWGYLGQFVGYSWDTSPVYTMYSSVYFQWRKPGQELVMYENDDSRITFTLGEEPGTYAAAIRATGQTIIVAFDEAGLLRVLKGSIQSPLVLHLRVTPKRLEYVWERRGHLLANFNPEKGVFGKYRYDLAQFKLGKRTVDVNVTSGSDFSKLYADHPFGVWQLLAGRTLVGMNGLLKIEVSEDGSELTLIRQTPDERELARFVLGRDGQGKFLLKAGPRASSVSKLSVSSHVRGALNVRYHDSQKDMVSLSGLARGDAVVLSVFESALPLHSWGGLYQPVTAKRLAAAAEQWEKDLAQEPEARARQQENARQQAAEERSAAAVFLTGLASGLAQANVSAQREIERNRQFQQNMDKQLRSIARQQDQQRAREQARRRADIAERAKRLTATNIAATKAVQQRQQQAGGSRNVSSTGQSVSSSGGAAPPVRAVAKPASKSSSSSAPTSHTASSGRGCRDYDDGPQYAGGTSQSRPAAERLLRTEMTRTCEGRGGAVGVSIECNEIRKIGGLPSDWACGANYRCAKPKKICAGVGGAVRQ